MDDDFYEFDEFEINKVSANIGMINGKARRKAWSSELGLNRYAATNNMIVLYPQAAGDARIGDGCWNWGGDGGDRFDDPQYDTRESLQLRTVVNMIRDQGCLIDPWRVQRQAGSQTSEGSFLAVSTPIFASKYSFE